MTARRPRRRIADPEQLDKRIDRLAKRRFPNMAPIEGPTADYWRTRFRDAARTVIATELRAALAGIPCFCTPDRPELERPDWCVRHLILDRLGGDLALEELAIEVLTLDLAVPLEAS